MANLKARGLKEAIPKTVAKKSPFPHLIQSNFLLQNIQKNFDKNSRLLLSLSLSLMLDILWKSETIWYCDRNWEKLNWLLPVWNQSYSGILCSVEREMWNVSWWKNDTKKDLKKEGKNKTFIQQNDNCYQQPCQALILISIFHFSDIFCLICYG